MSEFEYNVKNGKGCCQDYRNDLLTSILDILEKHIEKYLS